MWLGRKRKMHPGFARAVLITIVGLSSLTPAVGQELELPTPLEHYESFDVEGEAEALGRDIFASLDPGARQTLFTQLGPGLMLGQGLSELSAPEVAALLEQIDLAPHRSRLLEVLLHSSHIMDTVPESLESWAPMVHDGLLLVLDGMSGQRLNERIAEQAALPQDAPRSERILSFITKTPAFQKLGQILARYEETAPDIREAFQTLENSIYTMQANEAVELVEGFLGEDVIEEYDFQFEDYMVGEASVGAVIGATIVLPPETTRRRVVCKVLKTYVIDAMEEDLVSVEKALRHLEAYGDFYGIGTSPLVEMFREVRDTLADEIRVEQEQDNLRRAFVYFQNVPEVDIPAVYPCSNSDVTVMERIEGVKVTEGFAGDPKGQRKLARRLADVLIYDVLFEKRDAMFHGDPHAGNVFYVGGEEDPYRIALLDWGLTGVLDKDR